MAVKIISPLLYRYYGKKQTARMSGKTVGECLEQLTKEHAELRKIIFRQNSELHDYLYVSINKENTAREGILNRRVKDGDEIYLTVLVEGG